MLCYLAWKAQLTQSCATKIFKFQKKFNNFNCRATKCRIRSLTQIFQIMAKKTKKFTQAQLDTLYECWKEADNYKDRLVLIEERLPKVPPLSALKKMRNLAKTDSKWIRWSTRKSNEKEREKLSKQKEKEKKQEELLKKRKAREEKKKLREEKKRLKEEKNNIGSIRDKLLIEHYDDITERIEPRYFFCADTHQYVHNISCIFRLFSNQHNFSPGGACDKCNRMDKYISTLTEVIENGRQKRIRPDKASKGESKSTIKSPKARKTKARKAKRN